MLKRLREYFQMMKSFAAIGHIPVWRQFLEMSVIFLIRRIGPGYYLRGRFGRPGLPFKDKLQFYNGPAYVRRVYKLNDRLFHKASQHKVVEAALLDLFSIPTPQSFGYFQSEIGQCRSGKHLRTSKDLDSLLSESGVDVFVMKPCEGFEGRGFVAAERDPHGRIRPLDEKEWISVETFVDRLLKNQAGYLVQAYFTQHPELAELNPTSVNTVRIMVYRPVNVEPVCFGAFVRMGRKGALVDNGSLGGILANADIETGEIEEGHFSRPTLDAFDRHPDTGARIKGKKLPFWKEAKELSSQAILAFPNTRFVGLDIAFGLDGPVVIELNVQPDYNNFAVMCIPSRRALSDEYYQ